MTGSTALQQLSSSAVAAEGLQWSQRGNRLFYWRDSTLVGATLEEHNGRWQATEKSIATLRRGSLLVGVAPDGERALVAIPVDQTSTIPPGIRIIVNAVAEWMK
jgi:hypothetical protein